MRTRKENDLVHVADTDVLKRSFSHWPASQVFRVWSHEKSNDGKWYVWMKTYSVGIPADKVKKATPAQVAEYRKELRLKKKGGNKNKSETD